VTDQSQIAEFLKKSFPNYEFVQLEEKENDNEYKRFLISVELLAKANHLVCPASQAKCRMAYELMQYASEDNSKKFKSLDVPYSYNFDANFYQNVIRTQLSADYPDIEIKLKEMSFNLSLQISK
jgi:hypothetical protein